MRPVVPLLLALLMSACSLAGPKNTPLPPTATPSLLPSGTPAWLSNMIANYARKPVENPPASVYRYEYKGQVVYYVPPPCCDQYSKLFDSSGALICAPDGGFIGRGDGKCTDFMQERRNEQLIWKDPREP